MQITSSQSPPESKLKDKNRSHFKSNALITRVLYLLLGMILAYYINNITHRIELLANERGFNVYNQDFSVDRVWDAIVNVPARVIANVDIPKIYIDIKFKHLLKVYSKRAQALNEGALIQESKDFVPAKIRSNNNELKVKLRLKGDWIDHLEGKKISFRIHTKGKSQLFGLRRFSIQHPKARGFQGEALIHVVFREFGILSPRYSFIDVAINGDNIGIMALEEHFSKELLERNGRKEGVIIRFDESLLWDAKDGGLRGFDGVFDNYLNAPIDAFQSSRIAKSERLSREYATSVGLLRGFTDDQLSASDVFDSQLMGSYLAIAQFFGAWHEIRWHNQRFYFNPLTLKLEPISFDAEIQEAAKVGFDVIYETTDYFSRNLLKDKKIYAAYQNTLDRLKIIIFDGSLIKKLQETEQPLLKILRKEYFFLSSFDYKQLVERARNISRLNIENKQDIDATIFPQYIHAFLINNSQGQYLELFNALPFDVDVQSINWVDQSGNKTSFDTIKPLTYPITLGKSSFKARPHSLQVEYNPPLNVKKFDLEVTSNIKGESLFKSIVAQQYYEALKQPPLPIGNIRKLLSNNSYLSLEGKNTIVVKAGQWSVKEKIIIPKGYNFEITGGTQLEFVQEGCLVIYGSSSFLGSFDKPIVLKGINNGTWQGVVVFQANNRSKWSNVVVFNTTGVNFPLWKLTGGVTFYQSDVDIENSLFSGNRGEDALNIVHSDFTLINVDITNTQSDGFDGDFVTGTISGGRYQDIGKAGGGDGVDISGSNVSLTGTFFNRINDKAISVGENSSMRVSNSKINNVSIGAASKDKSLLKISDTQITNAHNVALMAYVKKPEFGPATLIATQTEIFDSNKSVMVQKGSYLELNGVQIETGELNVKQLYKSIIKSGVKK